MPPRVVIEVNAEKALMKLREAGVNVKGVEAQALQVSGETIKDTAMGYAPSPSSLMYPTESSGQLRDSHEMRTEGNKVVIQPMVYYAIYVHEGHFTAVKFERGKAPPKPQFIPPRPWLEHAVRDSRKDIAKLVVDLVQSALESAEKSVGQSPPI